MVIGNTPGAPAVPAMVAVPLCPSVNVTPAGRRPEAVIPATGRPVVRTTNDPATPVVNVALLTLVIAGTYGAAPALLERAQFRWSLSRLTLLHEWARALVLEQLYRAAKIAANEPYHH